MNYNISLAKSSSIHGLRSSSWIVAQPGNAYPVFLSVLFCGGDTSTLRRIILPFPRPKVRDLNEYAAKGNVVAEIHLD